MEPRDALAAGFAADNDAVTARAMANFLNAGLWHLDRPAAIAEGLHAAGFTAEEITRLQERATEIARTLR